MQPQVAIPIQIFEAKTCYYWLNDEDTLCFKAKDVIFTIENVKHDFKIIIDYIGTKKVKVYYDSSVILPIDKRVRLLLEEMLTEVGIALAVSSNSRIGIMVANIFLALSTTAIPMRMFKTQNEAIQWLETF